MSYYWKEKISSFAIMFFMAILCSIGIGGGAALALLAFVSVINWFGEGVVLK